MDHLAKDLTVALEESESCGPSTFESCNKWRMRRRTRSAGNLCIRFRLFADLYSNKTADYQSADSSSSPSEIITADRSKKRLVSFHQSDSDEGTFMVPLSKSYNTRGSLRMKHSVHAFLRSKYNKLGVSCSLESDSVNEHSPARPNLRRKRKLKRMSVDETVQIPPCGKRKRPQRYEIIDNGRCIRHTRIKPLQQSVVDKIEKFCQASSSDDINTMETDTPNDPDDNFEVASESSISWSGGEGHEGDDELTDWAPSVENSSLMDQSASNDSDNREIRAGCRRLRDERPSFSINTGANEHIAKFLQDTTKSELRLYGAERDKVEKLADLYFLAMSIENASSLLLRKTSRTPCMQPARRHHSGLSAVHKRIRTSSHIIS